MVDVVRFSLNQKRCGGCVDGETGLCAHCDDVVVDVGEAAVECYA